MVTASEGDRRTQVEIFMKRHTSFFPIIAILLLLSLLFFFLAIRGVITGIPLVNTVFAPLQRMVFHVQKRDVSVGVYCNTPLQINDKKLQEDTKALRDQFQTASIPANHLIPVHIVGMPGFIPGKSAVEQFVIDGGSRVGITKGQAVVYKDMFIGSITEVTDGFSQVAVSSNTNSSFSAKTLKTSALGVVKGQGSGNMVLENVLLDQRLQLQDIVVTKGDQDITGQGVPPNLIVGKITGIEKDPSALFQQADVTSLVDVTELDMVFVLK